MKEGVTVVADGGFDCVGNGDELEIKRHKEGLYFDCSHGMHFIRPQLAGGKYIGLYPKAKENV